ncbi:endonuclease domain-containing protein [Novosphingobium naphthalenivorans]|uniref:endonuclease domain-containing protein n=1 Tax=Novosphingobium naphthalenivorans TaxID=273168 RepID=UPI00083376AE|nr:DUF559 domain-containing protein [Novosphingobium naphthalenivorans]
MPAFKPRNTSRARQLRNEATPAERLLWRHLARSQLGAKFSRQIPVGPYFADFLCRELALVIELDGHSHEMRSSYDAARDRWMLEHGYHVLRFTNETVFRELEGVVALVREEIERLRCTSGVRDGPPRCG